MTEHLTDELPRLLTGEARPRDRARRRRAPAHLRRLPAGTGLGRRRARLADLGPAVRAGDRGARAAGNSPATPRPTATTAREPATLPDLSAVFAQVRREADENGFRARARAARPTPTAQLPRRGRRRRRARRRRHGGIYVATTGGRSSARRRAPSRSPRSTRARRRATARIGDGTIELTRHVAAEADRQALRGLADRRQAHPDAADRLDRRRRHRAAHRPDRI